MWRRTKPIGFYLNRHHQDQSAIFCFGLQKSLQFELLSLSCPHPFQKLSSGDAVIISVSHLFTTARAESGRVHAQEIG
jgi:hypothetical protein